MPNPPATNTYNDGGIPNGAPIGNISALSGVFRVYSNLNGATVRGTFKFEGPDFTRASTSVDQKNPDGSPSGSFGVPNFDTFTCSVQVPTENGPFVLRGDAIQEVINTALNVNEIFVCTDAGQAFPVEGYWKQQTSWKKVYNGSANLAQNPQ